MGTLQEGSRISVDYMKSADLFGSLAGEYCSQVHRPRVAHYEAANVNLFYLSRVLAEAICVTDSMVFIRLDTTIWSSGEDTNLATHFFRDLGFNFENLVRVPILGTRSDCGDFRTMLYLSVLFGWDAFLASEAAALLVDHDGMITISACEAAYEEISKSGVALHQPASLHFDD
jgi:hypothetical protein